LLYQIVADLVMLAHFGFTAFVTVGALLLLWRPWIAWIHLPAMLYGATIEFVGWTCPLTPLEQQLRRLGGEAGYSGGFLDHYLEPILYPPGWESVHTWLGVGVLVLNVLLYGLVVARLRRK
jgi:hypothetical protein